MIAPTLHCEHAMNTLKKMNERLITTYLESNKLFFSQFAENRDRAMMNNTAVALKKYVIDELKVLKEKTAQKFLQLL